MAKDNDFPAFQQRFDGDDVFPGSVAAAAIEQAVFFVIPGFREEEVLFQLVLGVDEDFAKGVSVSTAFQKYASATIHESGRGQTAVHPLDGFTEGFEGRAITNVFVVHFLPPVVQI